MYSDLLVQQLRVSQVSSDRLDAARKRELIRFAQASRPSLKIRMLDAFGTMLITAGQWLQATPASTRDTIGTRTELSQMKT